MKSDEPYSENAKAIYNKLYLARNENDEIIETIGNCHKRVATHLSNTDEEHNNFKRLLDEQKFRPNTPCMANAGIKNGSFHACFVQSLQDDMNSIIEMWGGCARIFEGGGGIGIPITNLRRKGGPISNGGKASGPQSYLNVVEEISQQVKSGGKARRAAVLIAMKYNHPDIVDLIHCKDDQRTFQSMNLSVSVDSDFMNNVLTNEEYPSSVVKMYDPNEGHTGQTMSVQGLWDHICKSAWDSGDPGLIFLDRTNEDNPLRHLELIESSNPCGEVLLPPSSTCCLGHLNLTKYNSFVEGSDFENDIYWAVLFLNRVIEKSPYPSERFRDKMTKYKPIGLGIMGLADYFYQNQLRYGSEESKDEFGTICTQLTRLAYKASAKLVDEGKIDPIDFPDNQSIDQFIEMVDKFGHKCGKHNTMPGNIYVTSIAPTGSCAISADCSYGFEPHMGLAWKKMLDNNETMDFLNDEFLDALSEGRHVDMYSQKELIKLINKNNGSIQNIEGIPQKIKNTFVVAHDIHWKDRIDMQSAAQENISMSISSTVNLPNSATLEDVSEVYKYAYEKRLKGITIYRDGCRSFQPVNFGGSESQEVKTNCFGKDYKRPMERDGKVVEIKTPVGKLYVRGSFDCEKLMEVFVDVGEQGSRENVLFNGIGRLISRGLQRGLDLNDITDTLRGSGGDVFFLNLGNDKSHRVNGILDAVATVLDEKFSNKAEQYKEQATQLAEEIQGDANSGYERCPECKRFTLRRDGVCRGGTCIACGYSNCQ